MVDWKFAWKKLANRKTIKPIHMVQYCVMKALKSKADDKIDLMHRLLEKTFTPVTNKRKISNGSYRYFPLVGFNLRESRIRQSRYNFAIKSYDEVKTVFDTDATQLLSDEEIVQFDKMIGTIRTSDLEYTAKPMEYYSYTFVRQDISPEQQCVQAAHATCVMGRYLPNSINPRTINFVLIGVADESKLKEVEEILGKRKDCEYFSFREPDLNNEITAVSTSPIYKHRRGRLKNFDLLTF